MALALALFGFTAPAFSWGWRDGINVLPFCYVDTPDTLTSLMTRLHRPCLLDNMNIERFTLLDCAGRDFLANSPVLAGLGSSRRLPVLLSDRLHLFESFRVHSLCYACLRASPRPSSILTRTWKAHPT
jgi:hypothetical protein